jgi:hypothetical protein
MSRSGPPRFAAARGVSRPIGKSCRPGPKAADDVSYIAKSENYPSRIWCPPPPAFGITAYFRKCFSKIIAPTPRSPPLWPIRSPAEDPCLAFPEFSLAGIGDMAVQSIRCGGSRSAPSDTSLEMEKKKNTRRLFGKLLSVPLFFWNAALKRAYPVV